MFIERKNYKKLKFSTGTYYKAMMKTNSNQGAKTGPSETSTTKSFFILNNTLNFPKYSELLVNILLLKRGLLDIHIYF